MAIHKRGKHSFVLPQLPVIQAWASVAGKKESEGPLAHTFDQTSQDTYFGQKTWEQAEKHMQQLALDILAEKAGMKKKDFELVLSGDLLNQCIGSSFSLRNTGIPHLGLYGACSTMAESLLMASMVVGGGFSDKVVAQTSSHFASSERQYRFPLGYGGQRTPTAQWTVTGSGAALVCTSGTGPRIECCTIGTVTDLGIKDANNMGAAMAPGSVKIRLPHKPSQIFASETPYLIRNICLCLFIAGHTFLYQRSGVRMTKKELLLYCQAEISTCDAGNLVDLKKVRVTSDLPLPQRAEQYLEQVGNPYLFRVDKLIVKVSFSGDQDLSAKLAGLMTQ